MILQKKFKLAATSSSFIQNINNWRLRIFKRNSLFNLISHQSDIGKIYLCTKVSYEAKYQLLINKRESKSLKHFNYSKAFIEFSNDMDDSYKNIEEYNPQYKTQNIDRI